MVALYFLGIKLPRYRPPLLESVPAVLESLWLDSRNTFCRLPNFKSLLLLGGVETGLKTEMPRQPAETGDHGD